MKTGLIGLGAMGARMARNLAKHRLLAAVWNRTEGVARNLAEQLAVPCAESPARLAEAVDAVLLCVAADRDVLEVIQRLLPGLRPTSLVIDLSTVSPETARQAASLVAERGAEFSTPR